MRTIVTLIITAAILALAGPASAKPYATFGAATAFNGAHQYARENFPGVPNTLKTFIDCHRVRSGIGPRAALWLCDIDTYRGLNTPVNHALIGVLRRDGHYVFRTYQLSP